MKFDFHTHHDRCSHAIGKIEDYIQSAIHNNLDMIGISDHSPFFGHEDDHPYPQISMSKSDFGQYVDEVIQLKQKYQGKIEVLLGVESDFFPEHYKTYKNIYSKYPFDYIIGSVHMSNGLDIFSKKRWECLDKTEYQKEKEIYYKLIQQSAKAGMFDILGHIDAMKGFFPEFSDIQTPVLDETLKVIAECDIAIEINTSGKTKECGGWYPSNEILERVLFYGGKVTFGSDAHTPARVAEDWEEVQTFLREIGYKEWAIFRKRKREMVSI
ncbi:histidinol-phosphatase [Bacillus basilensis]|uniref:histidinol-phosphatase n=1 Tax=Bacillus basilensis TaxID=3243721 RepID=UPI003D654C21